MATVNITIDDLSIEQVVGILGGIAGTNGHSAVVESAKPAAAKATKAAAPAKTTKAKAAKPAPEPEEDDDELVDEDDVDEDEEDEDEDEEDEEEEGEEITEEFLEGLSLPELRKFAKEQEVELPGGKLGKAKLVQVILDGLEPADEEDEDEDEEEEMDD